MEALVEIEVLAGGNKKGTEPRSRHNRMKVVKRSYWVVLTGSKISVHMKQNGEAIMWMDVQYSHIRQRKYEDGKFRNLMFTFKTKKQEIIIETEKEASEWYKNLSGC